MQSKLRSPVFVQVELTSKCNNNCIYCYNFWRASDYNYNRKDMSLTELRYVAEVLGNHDIFWATITGGEPFLRKTELFYFLDCLSKKNIQIMINSNATTLEEDDVKKLQNYSLNTFLVSLISYDDQKHDLISRSPESHKKAIRGLNFLLTYDIKVAVNMVATKLNFKDIYKTGKWLYNNFGIKNFSATPLCPSRIEHSQYELNSNEILESITQLISLKKEFGMRVDILEVLPVCLFDDKVDKEIIEIMSSRMCTAGNTTITIGSEGEVRVCSYDDESYGNILKENFEDIWSNMTKWRNDSLLPQECKKCTIIESCGGGCRVSSKIKKGSYCELSPGAKGRIEKQTEIKSLIDTTNISINEKFSCVPEIFYREENPGIYLLVSNPMFFVITNKNGLFLFKKMREMNSFSIKNFIEKHKFDATELQNFFLELFKKGFIFKT